MVCVLACHSVDQSPIPRNDRFVRETWSGNPHQEYPELFKGVSWWRLVTCRVAERRWRPPCQTNKLYNRTLRTHSTYRLVVSLWLYQWPDSEDVMHLKLYNRQTLIFIIKYSSITIGIYLFPVVPSRRKGQTTTVIDYDIIVIFFYIHWFSSHLIGCEICFISEKKNGWFLELDKIFCMFTKTKTWTDVKILPNRHVMMYGDLSCSVHTVNNFQCFVIIKRMHVFVSMDHMSDWHSCQICYPLEIKLLLLLAIPLFCSEI